MKEPKSIRAHWEHLNTKRQEVLRRAREASELTIPSLLPPEGHTEDSPLNKPYQSIASRAVNNLSAKMLLALFPPNTPFFQIKPEETEETLLAEDNEQLEEISVKLNKISQAVATAFEQTALRSVLSNCLKQLIVTGNALLHIRQDGKFRQYRLNQFVVNRDPEGQLVTLAIKECVSPATIPDEILEAVYSPAELRDLRENIEKSVDLFTLMKRVDGKWKVHQELNDTLVPDSDGIYPVDEPPFLVLRWTAISDEDYGRGMCEDYIGDLGSLDALSRDMLKASAAAAKIIFAVNPNSTIRPKDLANAESGAVLSGNSEDVGTIGLDKFADFRITLERLRDIEQNISEAFLMHTSIQRDAERVTAEEVRFMAQELEDALGGVYSVIAQELQVPLVKRFMTVLAKAKRIPKIPQDAVRLQVTTGLEALGRGHETQKLVSFVTQAAQILGPEVVVRKLNQDTFFERLGTGYGINLDNLFKSDQQVQQEMQQQMAQQALQQAAPGAIQESIKQQGAANG